MSIMKQDSVVDFGGLYQTYARDLYRFALFLSGNPAHAEDIVSETFIRLWNARSRVDLTTVKAYLFTIARNLFLQQRRTAGRQVELDEEISSRLPGPDQEAQSRSELKDVLAALQTLPEVDRAAVLMRADDGMSYDDIAAALGISAGAAKVKVHRARLMLVRTISRKENL
jgi:RNA polymerase sigma-70 factor (ECF subfamily)